MELFEQSVVAFFAAVGIAWAAWSIAEALFLSKREKLERCLVLIPAARDASALERTVARLSWAKMCIRDSKYSFCIGKTSSSDARGMR